MVDPAPRVTTDLARGSRYRVTWYDSGRLVATGRLIATTAKALTFDRQRNQGGMFVVPRSAIVAIEPADG